MARPDLLFWPDEPGLGREILPNRQDRPGIGRRFGRFREDLAQQPDDILAQWVRPGLEKRGPTVGPGRAGPGLCWSFFTQAFCWPSPARKHAQGDPEACYMSSEKLASLLFILCKCIYFLWKFEFPCAHWREKSYVIWFIFSLIY
jgi:hypothetical protein